MSQALFSSEPVADTLGQFFPPKVFAQPFRLVFKRKEDGKSTWVEIRSLAGLHSVFEKLEEGELVEIDRFSTIEMQLWGHLAEHNGFLRIQGNTSTLGAGIQPLGEGIAPLAEDLSIILGGDDIHALQVLDSMKSTLAARPCGMDLPMEQVEVTNEFVKADGVNLTKKGEDALHGLVFGHPKADLPDRNPKASAEAVALCKESENAIEIFQHHTPNPTQEEIDAEAKEAIDCSIRGEQGGCKKNALPPEGPVTTGPEAAKIGRLIADVGRGLDNEEDKQVQSEAQAAQKILDLMIAADQKGIEAKKQTQGLLERYDVTMDELKKLAGAPHRSRTKKVTYARPEPHEAEKASLANLQKLMQDFNEIDFAMLVGQSQPQEGAPLDTDQVIREQAAPVPEPYDIMDKMRRVIGIPEQTYGADHYKSREVKPASEAPMGQDERAKWLEDHKSNDDGNGENSS